MKNSVSDDLQNITQKTKDRATRTSQKTGSDRTRVFREDNQFLFIW